MKKRGIISLKNISNNIRKIGKQGTHLIGRKIVKIQMVRMERCECLFGCQNTIWYLCRPWLVVLPPLGNSYKIFRADREVRIFPTLTTTIYDKIYYLLRSTIYTTVWCKSSNWLSHFPLLMLSPASLLYSIVKFMRAIIVDNLRRIFF